jgi:ubiquinone/menaquinone biosynthesis C-methylase UbiE
VRSTQLYGGIFSRHAAAYRERHRPIRSEGRERALELLAVQPGERVLDLACGPGNLSRRLAAARGWVVSVDVAEGMLALAHADVPEAVFARMDLGRLGLAARTFDAALCGHGLQFLADLAGTFREARRILRPGGRLAASVPVQRRDDEIDKLIGPIAARWLNPPPKPVDAGDRRLVEEPAALRRRYGAATLEDAFFAATGRALSDDDEDDDEEAA